MILIAVALWVRSFESVRWNKATRSHTIKDYQEYLDKFPDGKHAGIARTKLDTLHATRQQLIDMEPANAATRLAFEMVSFDELFEALKKISRADWHSCQSGMNQPGPDNKLVSLLQDQAARERNQADFVNWLRGGTVDRREEEPIVVAPVVIVTRTIDSMYLGTSITPRIGFQKDGQSWNTGADFKLPCATTSDIMSLRTLIVVFRDYADLEAVIVDWPSARIKARRSISGRYEYSNPSGLVGGGSTKRMVYWASMWAWIAEQPVADKKATE